MGITTYLYMNSSKQDYIVMVSQSTSHGIEKFYFYESIDTFFNTQYKQYQFNNSVYLNKKDVV